ncbi:glycosyltransferase [Clostridium celatum]|uniref:glycosyltransferase n=1 Tax=Clostridium celatum TaxID=36834 RepID=UPI00319E34B4
MIKLSFIVPVYDVEDYVEQCVKSLCNQTINDIEIIIVNDGTQDNSIEKIEKINDDRIKIINQENSGLSSARNNGLKVAQGDYVAFVDSDDYIAFDTAYEEMYDMAIKNNSDIVEGNCIWYYSDDNKYPMKRESSALNGSSIDAREFLLKSLREFRMYSPVWLYIFKRNLLIDNKLFFKKGIYHEDQEFTPRVLLKANNVSIYKKDFYVYRQRSGSIMNSGLNTKRGNDLINICLDLDKVASKIENKELQEELKKYISRMAINTIYDYKFTNIDNEVKEIINENSLSKGLKIRSKLIDINIPLYIKIESIYRKFKGIGSISNNVSEV